MTKQKTIIDAKSDSKGNITKVLFEGNSTFSDLDTAIRIGNKKGISNAHSVHLSSNQSYIRTNPDKLKKNNLGNMASK